MTDVESSSHSGAVTGQLRALLRIEGLVLFCAATALYAVSGASWWLFALLLLAPDLSFVGYLAGPRVGAMAYNALHGTIGPLLLGLAGLLMPWPIAASLALIWLAHIGIDRALGYGLKYASGFGFTHLGRIGPAAESS
jgi:Domain of unknown function (DUF4260)